MSVQSFVCFGFDKDFFSTCVYESFLQLVIRRMRVGPLPGQQHSSKEIDSEIFSTVILSLPLIQEMQLLVYFEKKVHNTG